MEHLIISGLYLAIGIVCGALIASLALKPKEVCCGCCAEEEDDDLDVDDRVEFIRDVALELLGNDSQRGEFAQEREASYYGDKAKEIADHVERQVDAVYREACGDSGEDDDETSPFSGRED